MKAPPTTDRCGCERSWGYDGGWTCLNIQTEYSHRHTPSLAQSFWRASLLTTIYDLELIYTVGFASIDLSGPGWGLFNQCGNPAQSHPCVARRHVKSMPLGLHNDPEILPWYFLLLSLDRLRIPWSAPVLQTFFLTCQVSVSRCQNERALFRTKKWTNKRSYESHDANRRDIVAACCVPHIGSPAWRRGIAARGPPDRSVAAAWTRVEQSTRPAMARPPDPAGGDPQASQLESQKEE